MSWDFTPSLFALLAVLAACRAVPCRAWTISSPSPSPSPSTSTSHLATVPPPLSFPPFLPSLLPVIPSRGYGCGCHRSALPCLPYLSRLASPGLTPTKRPSVSASVFVSRSRSSWVLSAPLRTAPHRAQAALPSFCCCCCSRGRGRKPPIDQLINKQTRNRNRNRNRHS